MSFRRQTARIRSKTWVIYGMKQSDPDKTKNIMQKFFYFEIIFYLYFENFFYFEIINFTSKNHLSSGFRKERSKMLPGSLRKPLRIPPPKSQK